MIQYYRYRAKLAKLFRQKEALHVSYAEDIRKAHEEGKSGDAIRTIEHGLRFEDNMVDEEIALLVTGRLIKKATRRSIPTPPLDTDGMWEQCSVMSRSYVLTDQGITQLRSSLRKEQKERVELFMMVLAVLTGFIGAVTGLVAVIMK